MTLPGHPHIAYHDAHLCIDDVSVAELADRHGTPLYVYSRNGMLAALGSYQAALKGRDHLICYAMKANSNLAVLQVFARAGCGFDIVSGGELQRVIAAGGDPGKVVFSGVGKTRSEMLAALQAGVMCFNVESIAELDQLSAVADSAGLTANVSIRVNPNVDAGTHPYISTGLKGNKFGIAHEQALATYLKAQDLPGLNVTGIDCHIGSQITDTTPYLDALDRVLDLVEQVEAHGLTIHHLDLGGGLGIRYKDEQPPTPQEMYQVLLERIDARGHGHRKILLEPGRSLVGNAGLLVTEVLSVKLGEQKNFCIVDAAMNDLARPAMYEAFMDIVQCDRGTDTAPIVCDVVGPVCESGDWLGRDRELSVAEGDLLAVLSGGAYGMAMSSNYNSRGRAAEVLISSGKDLLIREREHASELFAKERLLPSD